MKIAGRYILAWSLALLLFSGAYWTYTQEDFSHAGELEETYARKKLLLDRLNALPEKEKIIKSRLANLGGQAATKYLYDGEAHNVQAYIQRDIRQIASEQGVIINTMRPLSQSRQNGLLLQSSVQLHFSIEHEKLMAFLDAIRRFQPLLKVHSLSVRVKRKSTASQAAHLAVNMEISGFRLASTGGQL